MYKITATIIKPGGAPIAWTTFSPQKLTAAQCAKRFSSGTEAGKSFEVLVTVEDFACVKVAPDARLRLPRTACAAGQ